MESSLTSPHRVFRSKSVIAGLLKEQQQSGLSITAFCAQHSIATGSFHNWKKALADKNIAEQNGFAPVVITSSLPTGLFAEVNGIKIYQPVTADYLKNLLP